MVQKHEVSLIMEKKKTYLLPFYCIFATFSWPTHKPWLWNSLMELYAFTREPELAAQFQIIPPIKRLFATASEIGVCVFARSCSGVFIQVIFILFVSSTPLWLFTDSVSSSPSPEVGSLCHYSNTMSGTLALCEPGRWWRDVCVCVYVHECVWVFNKQREAVKPHL